MDPICARVYAECIYGQHQAKRRIEDVTRLRDDEKMVETPRRNLGTYRGET